MRQSLLMGGLLFVSSWALAADRTPLPNEGRAAIAEHGMVSTIHPLATAAGVNVLKAGGNAIDAAVAAALTLGVVNGHNSGIGGGCFMLIRLADGSVAAIDGRETAPAAATRETFLRQAKADTRLSQAGALASGVPGSLAAYDYAVSHYGNKSLKELIRPAAEIAESGFRLDAEYVNRVESERADLERFAASKEIFLPPHGLHSGDLLRQTNLAATYRAIAEHGTDWFYRGPFAAAVERWMKSNGGLITARDFADYHICLRQALITSYRGYQLIGFPPPSSGGVHVAEILSILENFDLRGMDEPTRLHVIAEAMKLAFADRAYWLGDPDFADVPRGLATKPYAAELARKIDLRSAKRVPGHGLPPGYRNDLFSRHTTHFSVADAQGNWVACTATVNTSFGSKVVIPGTGVVMNNQMDDFSTQPGTPNYFGLIGAEANAVAPGKRPLSSMSPTIVLKDGHPVLALGASGGPTIISQVVLALVDILDLGLSPATALARPRIHHQWSPDELVVEKSLPVELRSALAERGHKLKVVEKIAASQLVGRTSDGKAFVGVPDPRAEGTAQGR